MRVVGSGFTFDGVWSAGTVTGVRIVSADNVTLLAQLTGVSIGATSLHNAMAGPVAHYVLPWSLLLGGKYGSDFISPGPGNDTVNGGSGSDWLSYHARVNEYPAFTFAVVNVDLALTTVTDAWGFTDTLSSIENVRGTDLNDTLRGNCRDNGFRVMDGADTIDGRGVFDTVEHFRDARFGGMVGVTVNLATGVAIDGFGKTGTISGIANVVGSAGMAG